jgi:hypothetical protein
MLWPFTGLVPYNSPYLVCGVVYISGINQAFYNVAIHTIKVASPSTKVPHRYDPSG